jgi:predicted DNA-binding transcriptional regulator YafY
VGLSVQRAVEEAVRSRQVIRLHFTDRHGTRTERDVEPVGFYGSADVWALIGWCRLRNAGRVFALNQIVSATLTSELAPPRDPDDVLGWAPGPTTIPLKSSHWPR